MVSKNCPIMVNTLVLFSWHNRLPKQHYDLLKTPLISDFKHIFQKRHGEFLSYYRILISRMRCNFWQSLETLCHEVQSHLKFSSDFNWLYYSMLESYFNFNLCWLPIWPPIVLSYRETPLVLLSPSLLVPFSPEDWETEQGKFINCTRLSVIDRLGCTYNKYSPYLILEIYTGRKVH